MPSWWGALFPELIRTPGLRWAEGTHAVVLNGLFLSDMIFFPPVSSPLLQSEGPNCLIICTWQKFAFDQLKHTVHSETVKMIKASKMLRRLLFPEDGCCQGIERCALYSAIKSRLDHSITGPGAPTFSGVLIFCPVNTEQAQATLKINPIL